MIVVGFLVYSVFIVVIMVNLLMFGVRFYFVNRFMGFFMWKFLKDIVLLVVIIMFIIVILILILNMVLLEGFYWLVLIVIISVIVFILVMYFIGFDKVWCLKVWNVV